MAIRISEKEQVIGTLPGHGFLAVCETEGGDKRTIPVIAFVILRHTERHTIRTEALTELGIGLRSEPPEYVVFDKRSNNTCVQRLTSAIDTLDDGLWAIASAIKQLAQAIELATTAKKSRASSTRTETQPKRGQK